MKNILIGLLIFSPALIYGQQAGKIDLTHWKLELPTGYTASEWKLSNFQKDRFARPFFYLDSIDGALVMEAYPSEGTSKLKYTKTALREQMIPGESSKNWTMAEGATLVAELQVIEMSKENEKKYHRTLLFQIQGTTTDDQEENLGLEKSVSLPLLNVYWQDERIRVTRKVLKEDVVKGNDFFKKDSWEDDPGRYFNKKVGFDKIKMEIKVAEDKVEVYLNDQKPIIFRDSNTKKWPFENYFNAGNYLQTKDAGSKSVVKFYSLEVTH